MSKRYFSTPNPTPSLLLREINDFPATALIWTMRVLLCSTKIWWWTLILIHKSINNWVSYFLISAVCRLVKPLTVLFIFYIICNYCTDKYLKSSQFFLHFLQLFLLWSSRVESCGIATLSAKHLNGGLRVKGKILVTKIKWFI